MNRGCSVGDEEGYQLSNLFGASGPTDRNSSKRVHQALARGVLVSAVLFSQSGDEPLSGRRFDESGRDLWKARRLETCTTGLGRGVRDIRALLWENQSLQPMRRALRLLYISKNHCYSCRFVGVGPDRRRRRFIHSRATCDRGDSAALQTARRSPDDELTRARSHSIEEQVDQALRAREIEVVSGKPNNHPIGDLSQSV
jgi:hypothetical protein